MSDSVTIEDPDRAGAATALFAWYAAMGVDFVVGAEAVDRFALSAARREQAERRHAPVAPGLAQQDGPPPRAVPAPAVPPNDEAVMAARSAAATAGTLDELRALVEGFDGCNLKRTARHTCFADGAPQAPLMLIGEAPGREEDAVGRPFVGRSGQLLDRILEAAGFPRATSAYIANVVYWRPPGNRDPSDLEIAVCRPFILRQIELARPKVLVFLGAQPMKALVGGEAAKAGIRRLRGRWIDFEVAGRTIPAMPTYHPAYLLRQPIEKRAVWRDMLAVRERLRGG
jgi:DNA polymerase